MSRNAPASTLYRVTLEVFDGELACRAEVSLLTRDPRYAAGELETLCGARYWPVESRHDYVAEAVDVAPCTECGAVHHASHLALDTTWEPAGALVCIRCAEEAGGFEAWEFPCLAGACACCGVDGDRRELEGMEGLCVECASAAEEEGRWAHERAHAAGVL